MRIPLKSFITEEFAVPLLIQRTARFPLRGGLISHPQAKRSQKRIRKTTADLLRAAQE